MGVRGAGSRTSRKEASMDGWNSGCNSQPDSRQEDRRRKRSPARSCQKGKCRRHPANRPERSAKGKTGSTKEDTGRIDEETKGEARLTTWTVLCRIVLMPNIKPLETKGSIIPGSISAHSPNYQRKYWPLSAEKAAKNGLRVGKTQSPIKDVRQRGQGNVKGRRRKGQSHKHDKVMAER
nr:hypothetical protein [Tanacetum cinerariifolium]